MIHAVGAAATAGPRAAPRRHRSGAIRPHPKVTLVGKGVCFDTGGLDIKPSSGMLLMKKDMGGAANALGLAHMIMAAGLPVRLRVLIPAVENAISGAAFRPGDVLRSRKGLTVEIGNTDAEGRLVLADALALAAEEEPELLVDLATLTGAARVALGPEVVPFYTARRRARRRSRRNGPDRSPIRSGGMPLWAPYRAVARLRRSPTSTMPARLPSPARSPPRSSSPASSPGAPRWLHVDIYAWNPSAKPGRPEGGEAQAIRALYALIASRYWRLMPWPIRA